jgi:hypothetical protein
MGKTSSVWKYFTKRRDGFANCNLCGKKLKTSGNTTNLLGHVSRMHKNHVAEDVKTAEEVNQNKSTNNEIEPESNQGATSADTNNNMSNVSTNSLASTVTLESSSSHIKKSNTIPTVFNEITQFKPGGKRDFETTNLILKMIITDNLPMYFVENAGFQNFLQRVLPLYTLPSRKTFSRLLDSRYETISRIFRDRLQNIDNYTLTADIWTETHQTISFLGITLHYLEGSTIKTVNLCVHHLEKRHTAENISEILKMECENWNIKYNKILAIVTDNGQNMVKAACDTFGLKVHVHCFAHTLNLVSENAIKSETTISEVIDKVKRIVTYFKQSCIAAEALRAKQIESGTSEPLKLIQCVDTRWNSKFYMLERFLRLRSVVSDILLNEPSAPNMISAYEINILKDVKYMLKPLEVLTKEVSADKYVTISKIIPMVHCLKSELDNQQTDSPEVINLKQSLSSEIHKRFGKMEHVETLAISTLLDPRFKKLHFKDYVAVGNSILVIKRKLEKLFAVGNVDNQMESSPIEEEIEKEMDLWKLHKTMVAEHQNKGTSEDDIKNIINAEVSQYINSPVYPLKSDPLLIWEAMKITYPHLHKLALKYLQVCIKLFMYLLLSNLPKIVNFTDLCNFSTCREAVFEDWANRNCKTKSPQTSEIK